jgi:hypothetical protein
MTPALAMPKSLLAARNTGLTPLGEATVALFRLRCRLHQLEAADRAYILADLRETVDEFSVAEAHSQASS